MCNLTIYVFFSPSQPKTADQQKMVVSVLFEDFCVIQRLMSVFSLSQPKTADQQKMVVSVLFEDFCVYWSQSAENG